MPGAESLGWLSRQRDLTRVFDARTIRVYRVDEPVLDAYTADRHIVVDDWGQVIALAQRHSLENFLIRVRHARPGPLTVPTVRSLTRPHPPRSIRVSRTTPVSSAIRVPRHIHNVIITEPAYPGWRLAGFDASSQFGVTAAFTRSSGLSSAQSLNAVYEPWRLVRICYVSGAVLTATAVALLLTLAARQGRRRRRSNVESKLIQTGIEESALASRTIGP